MPAVEPLPPLTSLNQGSFLRWAFTAAAYLAERQEELDALNVFPVPDGDTGTNLLRTLSSALQMLTTDSSNQERSLQARLDEMSRDALLSARGNSGVILSQLIVGLAEGIGLSRIEGASRAGMGLEGPRHGAAQAGDAASEDATVGPRDLATALVTAAERARQGVSEPVDGTILTVAEAASAAALRAAEAGEPLAQVVRAATQASLKSLAGTTSQLPALAKAGVVDAGGAGLVVILQALDDVVHRVDRRSAPIGAPVGGWPVPGGGTSTQPETPSTTAAAIPDSGDAPAPHVTQTPPGEPGEPDTPQYEVVYHLLDVPPARVDELAETLGTLGDSLVIGGGRRAGEVRPLVTVHVHTHDPGAAVEAAFPAGIPSGLRLEVLSDALHGVHASPPDGESGASDPTGDISGSDTSLSGTEGTSGSSDTPDSSDFDLPRQRPRSGDAALEQGRLGILAGASGAGVAELLRGAGAQVIIPADGGPGEPARLLAAVQGAIRRTGCATVLALPGRPEGAVAAQAAAVRANVDGVTVVVADTRSPVQALAALAVYDPDAEPEAEARRLAAVAEAVRCGSVEVAARPATFAAGRCRRGDLLAYGEGDVRAVGPDAVAVARSLVDHLLQPPAGHGDHGGEVEPPELVTLVAGQGHLGLAESLAELIGTAHPDVEVISIDGGQHDSVLLIGVE